MNKPKWLSGVGLLLDHPLGNALWFYGLWLTAVLGREDWLPLTIALLAVHLLAAKYPGVEFRSAIPLAGLGLTIDGALSALGFFHFEQGVWLPPWLMYLWLGFVMCLHRSLQFFERHWLIAIGGGGIGGTFSYWSAMRLDAVEFGFTTPFTLACLVVQWSLLFPLLIFLNQRLRNLHIPTQSRLS